MKRQDAHCDGAAHLDANSKQVTNTQLKEWAKKTLPSVQAHLRQAQQLKTTLR